MTNLTGSEKQIKWAEDIRKGLTEKLENAKKYDALNQTLRALKKSYVAVTPNDDPLAQAPARVLTAEDKVEAEKLAKEISDLKAEMKAFYLDYDGILNLGRCFSTEAGNRIFGFEEISKKVEALLETETSAKNYIENFR